MYQSSAFPPPASFLLPSKLHNAVVSSAQLLFDVRHTCVAGQTSGRMTSALPTNVPSLRILETDRLLQVHGGAQASARRIFQGVGWTKYNDPGMLKDNEQNQRL